MKLGRKTAMKSNIAAKSFTSWTVFPFKTMAFTSPLKSAIKALKELLMVV